MADDLSRITPLERLYPTRCYDCLAPTGDPDKLLCGRCEAVYAAEKERRRAAR